MPKVMLVNVTHVEESRVAVLDDGVLAGYEIETINRTSVQGNIYNAVVESANASLEAAFVRIGPERKGFLPLDEVNFKLLPSQSDSRKGGKIGQHLHMGQKLMVQVVREPFGGKPPTVSTYFSLPGRYLVLMPGVDSAGVSRKIDDAKQRERLKKVIDELKLPEGFGLIVRTAGMGQTKAELQRDLRYLLRLWESIQRGSGTAEFPGLVYRDADLVIRTIRDHLTSDIKEVWIDSKDTYEKALAFARDVMPSRAKIFKQYTGDRPLFNKFNLEEQIERIYMRRVPLPSGGEIVIDGTEALTAIDVNSARARRSGDVEQLCLDTNLEAAAEITRQIRLRDLGGLIVIDFIDMMALRNKKKVEKAMRDAMRGDRAKYDVTGLSKLGLMELSRQRTKSAKMAASYATCPTCEGYGLVKNVETAALACLRKLQTRSTREVGKLRVSLPPEVASWLQNNKREELLRTEQRQRVSIEIEANPELLRHQSEFQTFPREASAEEPASFVSAPPAEQAEQAEPAVTSRRRSRRGGKKVVPFPGAAAKAPEPAGGGDSEASPGKAASRTEPQVQDEPAARDDSAAEPEAAAEESASGGRRKRRRRRRRRGGSGSANRDAAEADGGEAPTATTEPVAAPPTDVRADELMPAATGSGEGSGRKRSSTRRRKSGSRRGSRGSGRGDDGSES